MPSFFDLIHFKELGQIYKNIFVQFLVQMKASKFAFEINWPLRVTFNTHCLCYISFLPLHTFCIPTLLPISLWLELSNFVQKRLITVFLGRGQPLNTSYLTDSYIVFTLKLESGQKFWTTGELGQVNMSKTIFPIFLHAGRWWFL